MSARRRKKNRSTASNLPAAEVQKTAVPKRVRPVLSRRRKWLFRLTVMVLAPVLFFTVLEVGLRLGGYGYPTTFLIGPDADGSYSTNRQYGWRFFPRALVRKPEPCVISINPAGAVRIFVLGSSAAQGVPEPSFVFGRILEVMLRDRYPDVQFEVINAAMTAINSHVVLEIARDCAAHQPDLFVVYMGNNEVVGPYGPGTVFQQWSPSLKFIRANIWVKSTRIGQLFDDAIRRFHAKDETPGSWEGMRMFLGHQVAADDPRLEAVYDNYRRNLIDLCGVARQAGAAVILSTVAVNLKDCPPLASQHRSDLSAEELAKWEPIYQAGVDLESKSRWGEALKRYEAASRIDDRFAELQFRLGRCLAALDRPVEARDRFVLARDLDVLRFRADSRINAVIREVAAKEESAGVCLVDAERSLAESGSASDGIVGESLFYEHVHLTFDGNYLVARAVLEQVESALPQLAASRKHDSVLSKRQCAEWLALTPWDEYQMAKEMTEMTSRPPFTNQLDYAVRQASTRKRTEELGRLASTRQAVRAACETYEAALDKMPDDWRLHYRFGKLATDSGQPKVAVEHLQIVRKKLPREPVVYNELGNAVRDCGRINEAISCFQKAVELDPTFAMAHNNLGAVLQCCRRVDEAIAEYHKALEIEPKLVMAHNNVANALKSQGQFDEAIAEYEKALEIEPGFAAVHYNLAGILDDRGRTDEAIVHYEKALEIDPMLAIAHNNLGAVLQRCRRTDEAIAHYEKAVEINPKLAIAHNGLGVVLARRGQMADAIVHFQKALKIQPDYAEARANLNKALEMCAGKSGKASP